jgi:hypothetical protein
MTNNIPMSMRCGKAIPQWRLAFAGLVAAAILGVSSPAKAAPAASLVDHEYAAAVQSFRTGRTSMAFGQFMEMANRGDVDAARVALFMYSYGPVLFGKQWDVLPKDVAYWSGLVRNSGTTARAMPDFPVTVLQPTRNRAVTTAAKPAGVKTVATAN